MKTYLRSVSKICTVLAVIALFLSFCHWGRQYRIASAFEKCFALECPDTDASRQQIHKAVVEKMCVTWNEHSALAKELVALKGEQNLAPTKLLPENVEKRKRVFSKVLELQGKVRKSELHYLEMVAAAYEAGFKEDALAMPFNGLSQ